MNTQKGQYFSRLFDDNEVIEPDSWFNDAVVLVLCMANKVNIFEPVNNVVTDLFYNFLLTSTRWCICTVDMSGQTEF